MKKASVIIGVIAIVAATLFVTGCKDLLGGMGGVTAEEQMANFKKYVEAGDYDSLKSCCLSTAAMYSQADAKFWETWFAGKKTFTYTLNGNTASVSYNQVSYTFDLSVESTSVYKVAKIDMGGSVIFQ